MTYGTERRPDGYNVYVRLLPTLLGHLRGTCQGQRIAQQHKSWCVIREVVAYLLQCPVDYLVLVLLDFMCLLVDRVCCGV